jgi:hypothetical protein
MLDEVAHPVPKARVCPLVNDGQKGMTHSGNGNEVLPCIPPINCLGDAPVTPANLTLPPFPHHSVARCTLVTRCLRVRYVHSCKRRP